MNYNDVINTMIRKSTSNSHSPMWRCMTARGNFFNIFYHADPLKDNFHLVVSASHDLAEHMLKMEEGDALDITVPVMLVKSDKFWNLLAVAPTADEAYKNLAPILKNKLSVITAKNILRYEDVVIWDTETTGTDDHDQIIELAAINTHGDILFNQRFYPTVDIALEAQRAHGISLDDLLPHPPISKAHDQLSRVLGAKGWITYNLAFDSRLLSQSNADSRYIAPNPTKSLCAMLLYADFVGEWDSRKKSHRWFKLTDACAREGVPVSNAHSALGDAQMTLALLQKLASYYKD